MRLQIAVVSLSDAPCPALLYSNVSNHCSFFVNITRTREQFLLTKSKTKDQDEKLLEPYSYDYEQNSLHESINTNTHIHET
jgi:hypothetical protein